MNHGGNGSAWPTTSGITTNKNNYVNKHYFPRNISSLIENLEIKINGQSRSNINQYNYIYNILNDFGCGHDCTAKNRIGQNVDPSNKTTYNNGSLQRYAGFPVGCSDQTVDNSYLDQDFYTIGQWLGILGGNASTSIIDTSLYGKVILLLCSKKSLMQVIVKTTAKPFVAGIPLFRFIATTSYLKNYEGTLFIAVPIW
jgi:hypothetical protein